MTGGQTGDYDRDGRTDFAVFRPGTSAWHIQKSSDDKTIECIRGLAGDVAVSSVYIIE